MGALSVPPLEWYPLGTVRPIRVTAKQQQKTNQVLRLPPTAYSRRQSRGLHPMGALSVPPLEWYPLGTGPPDLSDGQTHKKRVIRLPPTLRGRRQSRGLHPVGALSVPPLDSASLDQARPV